jgi:polysaccharide pyruvyl transferase WcaK-like protein
MNYGDVAMEAGVLSFAHRTIAGVRPGITSVALVRRSTAEVEQLCDALQVRPTGLPGLFIDVPGLIYGPSARGRSLMELTLRAVTCARAAGMRSLMVPGSLYDFGPEDMAARAIASTLLTRFDRTLVRDAHDQAVALSLLGGKGGLMPLSPDSAFLFRPTADGAAEAFLEGHVDNRQRPIVTVGFNRRALETWPAHRYMKAYKVAVSAAIEVYGKEQVVLIAHERRRFPRDKDDRYWTHRTAIALNLSTTVVFTSPTDPPSREADEELAYVSKVDNVIARASLHIATRYHAAVAALRAGVPVLCLSWAPKYEGLLRAHACVKEADIPSLVITHRDSPAAIRTKVQRAAGLYGDRECRLRLIANAQRQAAEEIRAQMTAAGLSTLSAS